MSMEAKRTPEVALWERALSGDEVAFGRLFDEHYERVFRRCYRTLGSASDADDAMAATFLTLWQKRKRVRVVDGSILPWLLSTATNVSLNMARSRRRHEHFLAKLPRSESAVSAEEEAIWQEGPNRELSNALGQLSSHESRLFSLVALEGFSPAEAAEALGHNPGAVRTRLHRIRLKLQKLLGTSNLNDYLLKEQS